MKIAYKFNWLILIFLFILHSDYVFGGTLVLPDGNSTLAQMKDNQKIQLEKRKNDIAKIHADEYAKYTNLLVKSKTMRSLQNVSILQSSLNQISTGSYVEINTLPYVL